jgi:GntR family transcriptional repressor for pyruvate dehydrogenase complex
MLFPVDRKIPLAKLLVLSKKEFLDLMALRLLIELDACRLAADHIRPGQLAKLSELLDEMDSSVYDPRAFIVADMLFHKQIALASGNVIYPRIFDVISELFRKQQAIVASFPGAKDRAVRYHRGICRYLERHDAEQAVSVLKNHLENTRSAIEENF